MGGERCGTTQLVLASLSGDMNIGKTCLKRMSYRSSTSHNAACVTHGWARSNGVHNRLVKIWLASRDLRPKQGSANAVLALLLDRTGLSSINSCLEIFMLVSRCYPTSCITKHRHIRKKATKEQLPLSRLRHIHASITDHFTKTRLKLRVVYRFWPYKAGGLPASL